MTQRGDLLTYSDKLVVEQCCACAMWFAVPKDFQARRLEDHQNFYCPAGHHQHYLGKTEAEKQRERAEKAEQLAARRLIANQQTRDQLDASERSKRALKGVVTRTKRRVGKGVCPCCNRTFQALAAHMETKHPTYVDA